MKITSLIILASVLTVLAFAQTNQTVTLNKVAVVNTESFYDEKTGIKKLANAGKQMGMIDCAAMKRYYSLT